MTADTTQELQRLALPIAAKSHGAWDGLEALNDLPDGAQLYAAPQPPAALVPLTDEQIQAAIIHIDPSGFGYLLRVARAIEAAHGITGAYDGKT